MITGTKGTVKLARKLRSEMSLPETMLWRELRKRPGDYKFRRQHPAGPFVLDFYCGALRLAIEVDGMAHDSEPRVMRDQERSAFLSTQGVATLRVPAKAVLQDIEAVVLRIVVVCQEREARLAERRSPLHHPADGPPPPLGEDFL
ncbi:DUF559 domain-containing protein [Altererythrobacter sp. KTW20L]|uniref:endonuclease domain-containing protein n=1 Tax=Altererythrobacter sp. KTW20L TaxID=2942210 RepID=UPI0020BFB09A|nr:DUF559 domain-containing protein [Altererythrobacter sp. KTW20L]